jgi:hypothetical protein
MPHQKYMLPQNNIRSYQQSLDDIGTNLSGVLKHSIWCWVPDVRVWIWRDDVSLCTYRVTYQQTKQPYILPYQSYVVATIPIVLLPGTTVSAVLTRPTARRLPVPNHKHH